VTSRKPTKRLVNALHAASSQPSNPVARSELGDAQFEAGRLDEACVTWRIAAQLMSGRNTLGVACVRENIAEARERQGRFGEARRQLWWAVRAWRRGRSEARHRIVRDDTRYREARCLAKLGSFADARRLLVHLRQGENGRIYSGAIRRLENAYPDLRGPRGARGRTTRS
jgi:Tetratricopeptide repeat